VTIKSKSDHHVQSACPLDCPDSCSLIITVADGRVAALDGGEQNPVTRGYICAKVRKFNERMYGQDRLHSPGLRVGPKGSGQFKWVDWDEALERVVAALRKAGTDHGGESILPFSYGGSNGLLTQGTADTRLFRRLGASRLARTVCSSAASAASEALYGRMPSVTYQDFVHARLIIVWGANPSVSGIHAIPFIHEAQKAGATLVVVDPRATPLARAADLHLPVRPGSDLPVALALLRELFETGRADVAFLQAHATGHQALREQAAEWSPERAAAVSGVRAEDIVTLAELYAQTSPALIKCGWGLQRNRNGGSAMAAILALPSVAGKFGVRGGGVALSNSSAWGLDTPWVGEDEPATRVVNMSRLGRALTELDAPPVKVLFVYNANPLATVPQQNLVRRGLERDDLTTIVFDQVMTDTARYADIVLPATTFLEHYDVTRAYGPICMQFIQPVVDAVGHARPNTQVFSEVEALMGLQRDGDAADELDMVMSVLGHLPQKVGEALGTGNLAAPPCGLTPVQFVDVFPGTADGKVHLFPDELSRAATAGLYTFQPDPATAEYPLALISPASDRTINSTLGELITRPAVLTISPADARERNLGEDDPVRVFNALGEVHCRATVSPMMLPGTVALNKGLWSRHTANGATANALAPDTLTDIGEGACFGDARVQVEKRHVEEVNVAGRQAHKGAGPGD
jgi:anaerobic selenocysteine-containing dehydrogenase